VGVPGGRLAMPSPALTAAGFILQTVKLVTSGYSLMSLEGYIQQETGTISPRSTRAFLS
jgi:hypothetical protein